MGDSIATNPFMLEVHGVAVQSNKKAFLWGRRAAHDLAAVEKAIAPAGDVVRKTHQLSKSLDEVIARRVEDLTAYQDAAYARRLLRGAHEPARGDARRCREGDLQVARPGGARVPEPQGHRPPHPALVPLAGAAGARARFSGLLAYHVEWHMRRKLAPMLDEDDDRATAAALRESIACDAHPQHGEAAIAGAGELTVYARATPRARRNARRRPCRSRPAGSRRTGCRCTASADCSLISTWVGLALWPK